jgi:hypothetical protein
MKIGDIYKVYSKYSNCSSWVLLTQMNILGDFDFQIDDPKTLLDEKWNGLINTPASLPDFIEDGEMIIE